MPVKNPGCKAKASVKGDVPGNTESPDAERLRAFDCLTQKERPEPALLKSRRDGNGSERHHGKVPALAAVNARADKDNPGRQKSVKR